MSTVNLHAADPALGSPLFEVARVTNQPDLPRFLIWIDAVGGFLVCPGAEVKFGQAIPASPIDVPLVADVSRHQLTIRRDAEGYVLDPVRETALNGIRLASAATLGDGDKLGLGPVELLFRRPHPLSATARVDFGSFHRTRPSCDAVLLMGDSCVLGPKPNSHIVCRSWRHDIVLFRQPEGLVCCASGRFEIDGREVHNRGALALGSRVAGDGFSFCLEELR
jgi:hypothetical protein